MKVDCTPLRAELAHWRREGLRLPLWWRDDDAVAPTPALDHLLDLSDALNLPVHLAIIPRDAQAALADRLADADNAVALVHGWAHANHAPEGAKKAEFGHPRDGSRLEIEKGLARLADLFGSRLLHMFVPPWNRIDPQIANALSDMGFIALSTYTPRTQRRLASLTQINTHIDPIHWKAGGGAVPPEQTIASIVRALQARRSGDTDATEPLGYLSHHLVHDTDIWEVTRICLSELLEGGATPCNLLTMKDDLP